MKIYKEQSLKDFEFWSGAIDTVEHLTDLDFDNIEFALEELYPDGMDETEINDLFWFEEDFIAEILGYSEWDELEEDRDEKGGLIINEKCTNRKSSKR